MRYVWRLRSFSFLHSILLHELLLFFLLLLIRSFLFLSFNLFLVIALLVLMALPLFLPFRRLLCARSITFFDHPRSGHNLCSSVIRNSALRIAFFLFFFFFSFLGFHFLSDLVYSWRPREIDIVVKTRQPICGRTSDRADRSSKGN